MKRQLYRVASYVVVAIAGMTLWAVIPPAKQAQGEVRATPQPQSFQTGGQLSVPVLKDIAATLREIDARLARLEIVAQKLQAPRTADVNVK